MHHAKQSSYWLEDFLVSYLGEMGKRGLVAGRPMLRLMRPLVIRHILRFIYGNAFLVSFSTSKPVFITIVYRHRVPRLALLGLNADITATLVDVKMCLAEYAKVNLNDVS